MECQRRPSPDGRTCKSLLLLFTTLLLLSPAPLIAAGGFRLCGLKLTMTLNAICKNQLCGGYILGMAKRRSPDLESPLPDNEPMAEEQMPSAAVGQQRTVDVDSNGDGMEEESESSREGGRQKRSYPYPYGAFRMAKKSGIATECCSKRCTLNLFAQRRFSAKA